ncbi:MAG: DUF58 domain-containing protein [Chloroflexi bacterium]|nr:DUF58 domain-containing protein [Chloroflexota bacterium]
MSLRRSGLRPDMGVSLRGIGVLLIATILLLFSMAIPWQPLFQLALGLYGLVGLCLLWIVSGLAGLRFSRPSPVRRGQVGQVIHDAFVIENHSLLPKLGLHVLDHSTLPGHRASALLNLAPRRRQEGALDTESELRGLYTLGPTGAASIDPFGLFRLEWRIGPGSELLIYPETVHLANFAVPGNVITEGTRRRKRTQLQTQDPAGARQYVYGDSMRRIHWASTAHAGQLMVKEYEFTPAADVWVVVDLQRDVHVGSGVHSTEEYAVTAAASVAAHYLHEGRTVGVLAAGRHVEALAPDRGERQLVRSLEALAVVRADGRQPLHEVLWSERLRFGRWATVIVVTPSTDERWAGVLAGLQHGGSRAVAILIEPSTFGQAPGATVQVAGLTSAGVATYLIKRSTSIREALQEGLLVRTR